MVVVHLSFLFYKQIHIHIVTIIIVLSICFTESLSLIVKSTDLSMKLWGNNNIQS